LIISACAHPASQYSCNTNICYYTDAESDAYDTTIITVAKPTLSFIGFTPVSFCDSIHWQVNVSIANTSQFTAYNDTILYYCYSGNSLSCLLGFSVIDSINGFAMVTDTVNLTNICAECDSIVAVFGSGCYCYGDTSTAIVVPPTFENPSVFTLSDSCLVSGIPVQFQATNIPNTTYLWNFGDGNTDTVANPEHTFNNYGYHCVQLTVENSCGTEHNRKLIFINRLRSKRAMKTEGFHLI